MAGTKVTIGEDRILRVDGRPFFPIGARHVPVGGSTVHLREAGFNCLRWPAFGAGLLPSVDRSLLDDLNGVMFYPYIYDRGDFSSDRDKRETELTELIDGVKNLPGMLCYEQRNEPACTLSVKIKDPSLMQSPPEGMIEASRLIRRLDPDHPIRLGHMACNLISTLRKYNEATDFVGCNPYPVLHPEMRPTVRDDVKYVDSPNQTISCIGDYTTKMMQIGGGRPVWMQLQAHANEYWFKEDTFPYDHHIVYPTYRQMRFMAFNAVVRGATAFEWSMVRLSVDHPQWRNVCRVIGELRDLHEILASPESDEKPELEYRELGYGDWTGVETLVKRHGGRPWLLTVNTQFDPMEAVFSELPEGTPGALQVYGEGRKISVTRNRFSDYFEPYEVHIYGPVDGIRPAGGPAAGGPAD